MSNYSDGNTIPSKPRIHSLVRLEDDCQRASWKIIKQTPHEVGNLDQHLSLFKVSHAYADGHADISTLQVVQSVQTFTSRDAAECRLSGSGIDDAIPRQGALNRILHGITT
tara:strand:- start:602 stop:934 length:333 start_codon:yes stop_codon:yes gene_type:complete